MYSGQRVLNYDLSSVQIAVFFHTLIARIMRNRGKEMEIEIAVTVKRKGCGNQVTFEPLQTRNIGVNSKYTSANLKKGSNFGNGPMQIWQTSISLILPFCQVRAQPCEWIINCALCCSDGAIRSCDKTKMMDRPFQVRLLLNTPKGLELT